MKYYNLCYLILILLLLTIILHLYNRYSKTIETLETNNDKNFCESLGIEIDSKLNCPISMSKINMAGNNIINFKDPPGLHNELNKLFIWRKLVNCCIIDFTYHENYIYGVGTNGLIYRVLKTGGNWIEYINKGFVKQINIQGNYIYAISNSNTTLRHKIDATGDWQEVGQKNWLTKFIFSDSNFLYGIGVDNTINYIPLSGGVWKNYSPGYVFHAIIFNKKIYAIGMDLMVYTYPLIPPPIETNPICRSYKNSVWAFCKENPVKKWGIGQEGRNQAIKNCSFAASKNTLGKCPIIFNTKWEKMSNCCVTNIQGFGDHLYGRGTDGKIYRVSLQIGGNWEIYINNGWVDKIIIVDNNLYGIGKDKAIYIHPLKNDKIEEFSSNIFH
tara:strand:+ start:3517 stop:4671 length:1155 start_codon:yes stop_codon:yes gene_type:complete